MQQLDFYDSSPSFLRRSSLTSSLNHEDEDDGFLEILDDNMEVRPRRSARPVGGAGPAETNDLCSPAGRRWDADGNGELADRSVSGRRRRRFSKLDSCSEPCAGSERVQMTAAWCRRSL